MRPSGGVRKLLGGRSGCCHPGGLGSRRIGAPGQAALGGPEPTGQHAEDREADVGMLADQLAQALAVERDVITSYSIHYTKLYEGYGEEYAP